MFKWIKTLLKRHVVDEAPAELAECEFGCRIERCEYGEWRNCENRIRVMNQLIALSQRKPNPNTSATQGESEAAR